ncbi:MotA/TolQ/ExbB proton channel family protein [Algisphaera agarilytica]|uniref:MotA/TolQ/ExbB proton channel domain-containing protein n=1 Tax=Algisphaera agarilytica TaxID=1385975 RepID=A0A7X0H5X8_9BACT|nr:MotA/TolQ/ExbB proton channel family protein [Algisphaera agarilytica]MBB6429733.1 hypothetical protein [Algisphaera agarilytica]
MQLFSRLIGLHVVLLGFAWTLWAGSGGNLGRYIDLPSLMGVVVLLAGCALCCFSLSDIVDTIGAVIAGPGDADETRLRQRVAVAAQAYQVAWGAGIVITLTGLITMLSDLSSPSSIGAGMAVALLSTFYGAFLAEFVIGPCRQTLLNHLDGPRNPDGEDEKVTPALGSASGLWRGAAVVLLILCCFFVLTVSFSELDQTGQYDAVIDHINQAISEGKLQPTAESGR